MLTPQEVSERAFPKASFGGYNMTQVDEFLDVLPEDYSALYSENAVLKSKMKVLVEKVEEYRSTEEAMRKALMTAQRMADDLVKEAEQKRDQILQEAAAEAQKKVDSIRQEAEVEQFRLAAAQKETAGYVAKVKALHAQAQAYLDQLRPWRRPLRRTRRSARLGRASLPKICPIPPSFRHRRFNRRKTGTWKRPPGSTLESFSSVGTMRSSRSISVLPSEIARPRLSCVSAASACVLSSNVLY